MLWLQVMWSALPKPAGNTVDCGVDGAVGWTMLFKNKMSSKQVDCILRSRFIFPFFSEPWRKCTLVIWPVSSHMLLFVLTKKMRGEGKLFWVLFFFLFVFFHFVSFVSFLYIWKDCEIKAPLNIFFNMFFDRNKSWGRACFSMSSTLIFFHACYNGWNEMLLIFRRYWMIPSV